MYNLYSAILQPNGALQSHNSLNKELELKYNSQIKQAQCFRISSTTTTNKALLYPEMFKLINYKD